MNDVCVYYCVWCVFHLDSVLEVSRRDLAYGANGFGVARGFTPLNLLSSLLRSMRGLHNRNTPAEASTRPIQTPHVITVRRILSCRVGSRSWKREMIPSSRLLPAAGAAALTEGAPGDVLVAFFACVGAGLRFFAIFSPGSKVAWNYFAHAHYRASQERRRCFTKRPRQGFSVC